MNNSNKLKIVLLAMIMHFCIAGSIAQDFHVSQYMESPLTLNPATTGMFKNAYRAHLHQRTQWRAVASKPFLTEILTFDLPYDRFGFGAYILNNTAGAGNLNEFHFLVSGAFQITEDNDIHHLCTGLQTGFVHKSVNVSKLTFDSQYSYETGDFDQNMSNGESFNSNSETLYDLNFGIYYYTRAVHDVFKGKSNMSGIIPIYAGLSAFHLTQPKEKFLEKKDVFYRKWLGYAGAMFKVHENIGLEPHLLYMRQAKNNEFKLGLTGHYYMKQGSDKYFFMLGTFYRFKDAAVVYAGVIYKEFKVAFSYDINTSTLRDVSRGKGGFEISITYTREADMVASFFKAIF